MLAGNLSIDKLKTANAQEVADMSAAQVGKEGHYLYERLPVVKTSRCPYGAHYYFKEPEKLSYEAKSTK